MDFSRSDFCKFCIRSPFFFFLRNFLKLYGIWRFFLRWRSGHARTRTPAHEFILLFPKNRKTIAQNFLFKSCRSVFGNTLHERWCKQTATLREHEKRLIVKKRTLSGGYVADNTFKLSIIIHVWAGELSTNSLNFSNFYQK